MWEWFVALTIVEQLGVGAAGAAILTFVGAVTKKSVEGTRRLRGKPEQPQLVKVVRDDPDIVSEPAETRPASGYFINVPAGREVVGRRMELAMLRTKLKEAGDVVVRNSGAILSGQGGIGKTTLARAYAAKYAEQYDGVLWCAAETRAGVIDGLMNLCAPLGLQRPEQPQEGHAVDVLTALQGSGQRWLIVYDNVEVRDDIRKLIPRGSHLIATTRQGEGWTGFAVQETDVLDFSREDGPAVALLLAEAGIGDEVPDQVRDARELAETLGGLPLALVMAGGLIRKEGLGFAEYLGQVERIIAAEPKNADYPDSVIGAVRLSYDKLDADARLVADLFAWWAPVGLEARLITDALEGANLSHFIGDIPDAVNELAQAPERVAASASLEERSVLQREAEGFNLHRMTAAALRAMQNEVSLNGAAAALLAAVYPADVLSSGNWPECGRLTPHVRGLMDSGRMPESAAMEFLLNQSWLFLDRVASYEDALKYARASLTLREARLPEADREVAVGHANLGIALMRLGDFDGAEAALRRSVALGEAHRPESRDLADMLEMLGGVLLKLGRGGDRAALVEALRQFQRAAVLWRRLVSRDHEDRASVLNNLGSVREALGQGAAALRLYGFSLDILRRVLPPGDARLGYGLMNFGAQALEAGAAARAEPLLEEALALRQAVYVEAPRHPEIVLTAQWLVTCLLVRARAGEDRAVREARARGLCEAFGIDFEERQAVAAQIPYEGAGDG